MLENWSFSTDLPLLITDENGRLLYWTPSSEHLVPGLTTDRIGQVVDTLPEFEALSDLGQITRQLRQEGINEARLLPLTQAGLAVIATPLASVAGHQYVALSLIVSPPASDAETRDIDRIFPLLNEHRDRTSGDPDKQNQQRQQVIQAEKLAAIGQLAAGVAHEINNPIGYICSNLNTLSEYIHQLLSLAERVKAGDDRTDLQRQLQGMDHDFIKADIIDCVAESIEGANRVRDIIAALKDFSHADDGSFNACSLGEVFSTTLRLVANELKYKCTLHEDYGPIEPIECNASQIKQVVMNLIVNASHAIEESGNIWLAMGESGDEVWFSVADDGPGIPDEIKHRIYEPFFTTKAVGQGTGLGLSLSYSIVQRHGGRIELNDRTPRGTCFTIWLPKRQTP